MAYHDKAEPGVPLGEFLEHRPGTRVALYCNRCVHVQHFEIEAVVAKLDARGLDGRRVGIRSLAGMVKTPCPKCGAVDYETRPAFPPVQGQGGFH